MFSRITRIGGATALWLGAIGSIAVAQSYVEKMSVVFLGNHSVAEIKPKIDLVLTNFRQPTDDATEGHLGSILVALRKINNVPEMDVLECMIGLGTTLGTDYAKAAALCSAGLGSH